MLELVYILEPSDKTMDKRSIILRGGSGAEGKYSAPSLNQSSYGPVRGLCYSLHKNIISKIQFCTSINIYDNCVKQIVHLDRESYPLNDKFLFNILLTCYGNIKPHILGFIFFCYFFVWFQGYYVFFRLLILFVRINKNIQILLFSFFWSLDIILV